MKKLIVNPGVCGLESIITVENTDDGAVVKVESKCPAVTKMVESLEPLEPYSVVFSKPGQGPIYEAAINLSHGACPVPSAIIKCIEAECKLALAKDVSMHFEE